MSLRITGALKAQRGGPVIVKIPMINFLPGAAELSPSFQAKWPGSPNLSYCRKAYKLETSKGCKVRWLVEGNRDVTTGKEELKPHGNPIVYDFKFHFEESGSYTTWGILGNGHDESSFCGFI